MPASLIEQPDAPALLEIARQTLLDAVLPQLTGDARFKALMVANAMAIAARAARADPAGVEGITATTDSAMRDLSADIRSGRHDPGGPSHDATARRLLALAEYRCRVSAPKALG